MMRLDRRRGTDVWLGEKMIFFAIGAALGFGGMLTGQEWLIYVAIFILVSGFVLRLLGRRRAENGDAPPGEERDSDWARAVQGRDTSPVEPPVEGRRPGGDAPEDDRPGRPASDA
jgi:hypothetical protein